MTHHGFPFFRYFTAMLLPLLFAACNNEVFVDRPDIDYTVSDIRLEGEDDKAELPFETEGLQQLHIEFSFQCDAEVTYISGKSEGVKGGRGIDVKPGEDCFISLMAPGLEIALTFKYGSRGKVYVELYENSFYSDADLLLSFDYGSHVREVKVSGAPNGSYGFHTINWDMSAAKVTFDVQTHRFTANNRSEREIHTQVYPYQTCQAVADFTFSTELAQLFGPESVDEVYLPRVVVLDDSYEVVIYGEPAYFVEGEQTIPNHLPIDDPVNINLPPMSKVSYVINVEVVTLRIPFTVRLWHAETGIERRVGGTLVVREPSGFTMEIYPAESLEE